ncbi:hypothetical protein pdam_00014334 [Pocillopora damicornis]|uniref:Uncharacterized protein n=1 Tax=Pocillopora damicornis TaxID=46731 RepID=A0A3M6U4U5_POCDA|nr:hypothetical protein pdam_00014334 [Pocillopora damicornis]
MVSSDKVNPDTDNILLTGNQDCGKKPEKRPATTAEGNSEVAEKTGKTGQQRGKDLKKKKKRLSGNDMELAILNMMKLQQESIQRSKENDKRVFEALLKSQAEAQQLHQEFANLMRDLELRGTYTCSTVHTDRRDYPADLKHAKLVPGEIRTHQCRIWWLQCEGTNMLYLSNQQTLLWSPRSKLYSRLCEKEESELTLQT